jgi:hypothetical protein
MGVPYKHMENKTLKTEEKNKEFFTTLKNGFAFFPVRTATVGEHATKFSELW